MKVAGESADMLQRVVSETVVLSISGVMVSSVVTKLSNFVSFVIVA